MLDIPKAQGNGILMYLYRTMDTFYIRQLLHQAPFTTFTLDTFYTRHLLHQTPVTPDNFYNKQLLHPAPFTPETFYTRHLLHQTAGPEKWHQPRPRRAGPWRPVASQSGLSKTKLGLRDFLNYLTWSSRRYGMWRPIHWHSTYLLNYIHLLPDQDRLILTETLLQWHFEGSLARIPTCFPYTCSSLCLYHLKFLALFLALVLIKGCLLVILRYANFCSPEDWIQLRVKSLRIELPENRVAESS